MLLNGANAREQSFCSKALARATVLQDQHDLWFDAFLVKKVGMVKCSRPLPIAIDDVVYTEPLTQYSKPLRKHFEHDGYAALNKI